MRIGNMRRHGPQKPQEIQDQYHNNSSDLDKLKAKLESYISYFNWGSLDAFPKEGLQKTFDVLRSKFKEKIIAEEDDSLSYRAFKTITNLATLAYLSFDFRRFKDAFEFLGSASEFIEFACKKGYLNSEHSAGMKYVLDGFHCHLKLLDHVSTPFVRNGQVLKDFDDLSDKAKAAVLGTKVYFFTKLRKFEFVELRINILKRIIQLDPDHFEWHLILYRSLRYLRREKGNKNRGPCKSELLAFETAFKLEPNHRGCILAHCLCVADVHRSTYWFCKIDEDYHLPITVGSRVLASGKEILQFYHAQAKRLVYDKGCTDVGMNVAFARIFGASLPWHLCDFTVSKALLNRTLEVNPNSEKAQTCLAFWHLLCPSSLNFGAAKIHFNRAVALNPRYYPATIELLLMFLNNLTKNEQDFKNLFIRSMSDKGMEGNIKATFYFIGGLFHFTLGHLAKTMKFWNRCYELHPYALAFNNLKKLSHRYRWPLIRNSKIMNLPGSISQIADAFKQYEHIEVDEETIKKFGKVHEQILKINQRTKGWRERENLVNGAAGLKEGESRINRKLRGLGRQRFEIGRAWTAILLDKQNQRFIETFENESVYSD